MGGGWNYGIKIVILKLRLPVTSFVERVSHIFVSFTKNCYERRKLSDNIDGSTSNRLAHTEQFSFYVFL